MAGRPQADSRIFALPDLNSDRSSPASSIISMAKPQPTMINKLENQFVLPSQAFVPIKDNFSATQKDSKKREVDAIIHQQAKMQEKLKELEVSNQHLSAEVNNLKKLKDNHTVDGQTEHALRNATDMTLYLTKKLQNMHESITKMEVRLQQQEKTTQEEKGGMAALADKVVEIEANSLVNCEERLTKQNNELLAFRDSLQDLRKRLSDEQMERKTNEQKIVDRLNRQKEEIANNRPQNVQHLPSMQFNTITPKMEEKLVELAGEVYKKNISKDLKPVPKDHASDLAKIQEEIERLKKQVEMDGKRMDGKRWAEFKKEQEEELGNIYQSVKADRLKINQEFKTIKDSTSLLADKQMDQHKYMQEKLQAEILTRQQFECDTLRQMTVLDDKLIKIGSSFNLPNIKNIKSGNSDLVIKEVDSLKKLIVETEKNLEHKIENTVSKLRPSRSPINNNNNDNKDIVKTRDLEELERNLMVKVNKCKSAVDKNSKDIETLVEWRDNYADKNIKDLNNNVAVLKLQVDKLPLSPVTTKDNELLVDLNRKVLNLDESVDDYKIYKETSTDAIEDLKRRMKTLMTEKSRHPPSANKNEENKTGSANEYSVSPEWKEHVDVSLEEVHRQIKTNKEKAIQHESKLTSLKKEMETETKDRINAIVEVKGLIKDAPQQEQQPTHEPKSNSAKEGLKKLANALQGTKNVLALKMQHDTKERENAEGFIQKRLEDLDNTVDDIDNRLHELEIKSGTGKEKPHDKEKPNSEKGKSSKKNDDEHKGDGDNKDDQKDRGKGEEGVGKAPKKKKKKDGDM